MNTAQMVETIEEAVRSGKLAPETSKVVITWLTDPAYASQREDLAALIARKDYEEVQDAFGSVIPFGTGGRRGAMGPGPNRINERTIAESTEGLCKHVLESARGRFDGPQERGRGRIVIAFDTRRGSRPFSEVAASVIAGNGLEALLFEDPRSTPELSFAVRRLGARAGIVISASHNPPNDNGFKAYWSDGGQVVPPHDKAIIDQVLRVREITRLGLEEAARQGLFRRIGEEIDREYANYTAKLSLVSGRAVKIVYSPLHGTGTTSVAPALDVAGFRNVQPVPSQYDPDPTFSGVPGRSPNPENPPAVEAAVRQARETGADLVLASDPDADRLGAVVRHRNDWVFLTGNRIGVLIFEHVARQLSVNGKSPRGGLLLKTCVTTDLLDRIAESYGLHVQGDFLVGFKYIAEAIESLTDPGLFVFGIEESHGYLRGSSVRDKDAAQAAVLLSERAAELKEQGRTLVDALEEIWGRYGYYSEVTRSIPLDGKGSSGNLGAKIMDMLRDKPPRSIAGEKVLAVVDRRTGSMSDPETGRSLGRATGTSGNLLVFHLAENGAERISIRPSGTEPKIKMYVQVRSKGCGAAAGTEARAALDLRAETLAADFTELARRS